MPCDRQPFRRLGLTVSNVETVGIKTTSSTSRKRLHEIYRENKRDKEQDGRPSATVDKRLKLESAP